MRRWAEIAAFEPDDRGGFIHEQTHLLPDGGSIVSSTRVSSDGMDEMIAQARMMEELAPALEAVTATLGMCSHGVLIPDAVERGELRWSINDYWAYALNARPTELVLTLWGWHEDDTFCIDWAFNPAGVLFPW